MSERPPIAVLLTFAREGEEEAIAEALAWLRRELPGARVLSVGTPASAPVLQGVGVDEVALFDGRGTREALREVQARRPAMAAVIYGGPGYRAHLKLEVLAFAIGAGRSYRFAPDRPPQALGRARLLASVMGKVFCAAASLLRGLLICGGAFCWLLLAQAMGGGGRARWP